MPLFIYRGLDGPRGLELRKQHRPSHLAHMETLDRAGRIRFAGPLLDPSGQPVGSLIVLEADDLESARAVAEADPYNSEGVFERIDVHQTRQIFPALGEGA